MLYSSLYLDDSNYSTAYIATPAFTGVIAGEYEYRYSPPPVVLQPVIEEYITPESFDVIVLEKSKRKSWI